MNLKEIRYVLAIAEEGSLTQAAQKLYISQSSLSQFLNEYENQLGFPLFTRVARGMTLTPSGKAFMQTAKQITQQFDRMLDGLTAQKEPNQPGVRLGIPEQRGMVVTPLLIPRFTQRNPDIRLDIIDGNAKELQEMVRERKLNLALCASLQQRNETINGVNFRIIQSEEFLLAVPRQHPLVKNIISDEGTKRCWLDLKDIRKQDFVLFDAKRNIRKFCDKLIKEDNLLPNVLQTSTNMSTILKICINQNALAFVPKGLVSYNSDMIYVSIGKRGKFWNLVLITTADNTLTKIENELVSVLSDCLMESCQ